MNYRNWNLKMSLMKLKIWNLVHKYWGTITTILRINTVGWRYMEDVSFSL